MQNTEQVMAESYEIRVSPEFLTFTAALLFICVYSKMMSFIELFPVDGCPHN